MHAIMYMMLNTNIQRIQKIKLVFHINAFSMIIIKIIMKLKISHVLITVMVMYISIIILIKNK